MILRVLLFLSVFYLALVLPLPIVVAMTAVIVFLALTKERKS